MNIDLNVGYFDCALDAHDREHFRKISRNKEMIYRAYINSRLLFWKELIFTDSTINNNEILRNLMIQDKQSSEYIPCDYIELLKAGCFKVAIRNNLEVGKSANCLYELQKNSTQISLPDEKYVKQIDEVLNINNTLSFSINDISKAFTYNIKKYLTSYESRFYIKKIKESIYLQIQDRDTVTLNELLELLNKASDNENYRNELHKEFSNCYKTNVPKALNYNYETVVFSTYDDNIIKKHFPREDLNIYDEEIISCNYAFNPHFLAYLPSEVILSSFELNERNAFMTAITNYFSGNIDHKKLLTAYKKYFSELECLFKYYYEKEYKKICNGALPEKSLHIKIFAESPLKYIPAALGIGMGFISTNPWLGAAFGIGLEILNSIFTACFVNKYNEDIKNLQKYRELLSNMRTEKLITR